MAKPKVKLVCGDHPKYKAIHPPKAECLVCWKIYSIGLRQKLKNLKNYVN